MITSQVFASFLGGGGTGKLVNFLGIGVKGQLEYQLLAKDTQREFWELWPRAK